MNYPFTFKTKADYTAAEISGHIPDFAIVRIAAKYPDGNTHDNPYKSEEEYLQALKAIPAAGGEITSVYPSTHSYDMMDYVDEFKNGGTIGFEKGDAAYVSEPTHPLYLSTGKITALFKIGKKGKGDDTAYVELENNASANPDWFDVRIAAFPIGMLKLIQIKAGDSVSFIKRPALHGKVLKVTDDMALVEWTDEDGKLVPAGKKKQFEVSVKDITVNKKYEKGGIVSAKDLLADIETLRELVAVDPSVENKATLETLEELYAAAQTTMATSNMRTVEPAILLSAYNELFPEETPKPFQVSGTLRVFKRWLDSYMVTPNEDLSVVAKSWEGKMTRALFKALAIKIPKTKPEMLAALTIKPKKELGIMLTDDKYDLRLRLNSDYITTIRDFFVKLNGKVNKTYFDNFISGLNPDSKRAYEKAWKEYKELSDIREIDGHYINSIIYNNDGIYGKGGKIKKIYAILYSSLGVIADTEVTSEDKNKAIEIFETMGIKIPSDASIRFSNTAPYYYENGGTIADYIDFLNTTGINKTSEYVAYVYRSGNPMLSFTSVLGKFSDAFRFGIAVWSPNSKGGYLAYNIAAKSLKEIHQELAHQKLIAERSNQTLKVFYESDFLRMGDEPLDYQHHLPAKETGLTNPSIDFLKEQGLVFEEAPEAQKNIGQNWYVFKNTAPRETGGYLTDTEIMELAKQFGFKCKFEDGGTVMATGGQIYSDNSKGTLVFQAATKGGRYVIEVRHSTTPPVNSFSIYEFKNGSGSGGGSRNTLESITDYLLDTIIGNKEIDGINYIIGFDALRIGDKLGNAQKIWHLENSQQYRNWAAGVSPVTIERMKSQAITEGNEIAERNGWVDKPQYRSNIDGAKMKIFKRLRLQKYLEDNPAIKQELGEIKFEQGGYLNGVGEDMMDEMTGYDPTNDQMQHVEDITTEPHEYMGIEPPTFEKGGAIDKKISALNKKYAKNKRFKDSTAIEDLNAYFRTIADTRSNDAERKVARKGIVATTGLAKLADEYIAKRTALKEYPEGFFAKGGVVRKIPKGDEYRFTGGSTEKPFAGNFELKEWNNNVTGSRGGTGVLYELDDFDKQWVAGVYLKPDERIYRYVTDVMVNMMPLIKVNIERGLIYFLTEEAHKIDKPIFETRGIKAKFLNLRQYAKGGEIEYTKQLAEKMFKGLSTDSYMSENGRYHIANIAIHRMINDGLVEYDTEEGKNYYWLNEKGKKEIKSAQDIIDGYMYSSGGDKSSEAPYLRGNEREYEKGGGIETTKHTKKDVIYNLRNNLSSRVGYKILDAFIVGSEAKGTAKPTSDIDVAVIIPPVKGKTALQITEHYHSKFRNDNDAPKVNGRVLDFQFFYPEDAELKTYSKQNISGFATGGSFTKCPVGTEPQSLLINKNKFTLPKARAWAKRFGYKFGKVDTTENYHRFRQQDPKKFTADSFRTIEFTEDIKLVIGCPKNKKMAEGGTVATKEDFIAWLKAAMKIPNKWHFLNTAIGDSQVQVKMYVGAKEVDVQIFNINGIHNGLPKNYAGKKETMQLFLDKLNTQQFAAGGAVENIDEKLNTLRTQLTKTTDRKEADYLRSQVNYYADKKRGKSRYDDLRRFELGGSVFEQFANMQLQVANALLANNAISNHNELYDLRNYIQGAPFSALSLIEHAVMSSLLSIDELNADIVYAAKQTVDVYSDLDVEEFGSSDWTYALKQFMDGTDYPVDFVDDRLVRVDKKYFKGGDLKDDAEIKELQDTLDVLTELLKAAIDKRQHKKAGELETEISVIRELLDNAEQKRSQQIIAAAQKPNWGQQQVALMTSRLRSRDVSRSTDASKRPSPSISATVYPEGYQMTGNDGNMWIIGVDNRDIHRWKKMR